MTQQDRPLLSGAVQKVSVADLVALAEKGKIMLDDVRNHMLSPHPRKKAPTFTASQLQARCGIDRLRMNYVINNKDTLPPGTSHGQGRHRIFTLPEMQEWMRVERYNAIQRPASALALIMAVVNFKGGSTKTTTAMSLAQGISLRGHRVLLVDLDPQGSSTALCSILPDAEVSEEDTVLPAFFHPDTEGYRASLEGLPIETYWNSLDLIPACSDLFSAEFLTPNRAKDEPGFEFWRILESALEPLRSQYDVIVLDTSPSLSYLTMNALMAAQGLIMPLPPDGLDFASSVSFWNLVAELADGFSRHGHKKEWDFVQVVMSKVDSTNPGTPVIKDWIRKLYGQYVSTVELPKSAVVGAAATSFGTLYDLPNDAVSAKTYARIADAMEQFIDSIEERMRLAWDVRPPGDMAPIKLVRAKAPSPAPQTTLI